MERWDTASPVGPLAGASVDVAAVERWDTASSVGPLAGATFVDVRTVERWDTASPVGPLAGATFVDVITVEGWATTEGRAEESGCPCRMGTRICRSSLSCRGGPSALLLVCVKELFIV